MVEAVAFRRDLSCRIAAFPSRLPAQCERREDLLARLPGSPRLRLDPQALAALQAYDFPGNFRELRNTWNERCCSRTIHTQVLPLERTLQP